MHQAINPINTYSLLQQVRWVFDPVGYMQTAARQYPDIFTASIVGFGTSILFVNDSQSIQQILTNDRKQFSAPGELNAILKPFVGNASIFTIEGDRHKKRRQMVMPAFHGSRMQNYGKLIYDLTIKALDQIQASGNRDFIVRSVMQNVSLQVILKTVFGLYEGDRFSKLGSLLSAMTELFTSPLTSIALFFPSLQKDLGFWSPWGKFVSYRTQIDEIIYAEIAERRANSDPERTDILSMLLSSVDEEGKLMSDQELHDELMALLIAGHETTATAVTWALYWIHQLPDVKAKLLEELTSVNHSTDWMSIFRLPYLTAVCNESLRIHPVAMLTFPRMVEESVEILGHAIDPKTIVIGCIYLLHQREDLYPNPQQFRPERFLERQFSPYEFMPFGGGVRRCVGEALAQFEIKIILATILSHYNLELSEQKPVKPKRRGVTLAPAGGIKMSFAAKRS